MKYKASKKNRKYAIANAIRRFTSISRTFLIRYIGIRGYPKK
jgi:hypothetical protein